MPHRLAKTPLALVQSSSLSMLLQQEIERMILDGQIAVGEWLNESALAQRFGVSRGPVREAFRSLEQSGLLKQEKNRGVFVREISLTEADEIYDLREALDQLVGKRVAVAASAEQLEVLQALVEQMEEATRAGDIAQYHPLNLRFHDSLVQFTANAKLITTYRRLINELHLFRLRGLAEFDGMHTSMEEHRAIVKAIGSRDPEAAGRLLQEHAVGSRRRMHAAHATKK